MSVYCFVFLLLELVDVLWCLFDCVVLCWMLGYGGLLLLVKMVVWVSYVDGEGDIVLLLVGEGVGCYGMLLLDVEVFVVLCVELLVGDGYVLMLYVIDVDDCFYLWCNYVYEVVVVNVVCMCCVVVVFVVVDEMLIDMLFYGDCFVIV